MATETNHIDGALEEFVRETLAESDDWELPAVQSLQDLIAEASIQRVCLIMNDIFDQKNHDGLYFSIPAREGKDPLTARLYLGFDMELIYDLDLRRELEYVTSLAEEKDLEEVERAVRVRDALRTMVDRMTTALIDNPIYLESIRNDRELEEHQ